MITQQYLQHLFSYADGLLYWKISRSHCIHVGDLAGCGLKNGRRTIHIDGHLYYVHRLVFLYHYGWLPNEIDHIDANPNNSRVENLRAATRNENQYNARLRADSISGAKNVHWYRQTKKWCVVLRVNKTRKHIGYFSDFELAELVATEARNKFHGAFARSK